MKRDTFIKSKTPEQSPRLQRYREACRVFEEFNTLKKRLQEMAVIFGEVEDIINKAILNMPGYALIYEFYGKEQVEGYVHEGDKFQVKFRLRDENTTLRSGFITLKIEDVFELTQEMLIVRIRRQMSFERR